VLNRIMTDCGFEVAEARHGREALTYLQSHVDTDIALIDWNMPEMNGLELVEAVRGDARLNDLRMMMVTTETEISHIERALLAGANEYVMKPFSREIIEEKLHLLGVCGGDPDVT
jgi:two-component system chemotaxis response regulator CheY